MEWMMHGTARAIKVPLPGLRTSRPSSTKRCRALRMVERPTWKKRVSSASVGMRSPGLIPMRWARNRSAACSYRERTLSRSKLSMGGSRRSVLFIFHHPHTMEDIYFLIARGRAPVKLKNIPLHAARLSSGPRAVPSSLWSAGVNNAPGAYARGPRPGPARRRSRHPGRNAG